MSVWCKTCGGRRMSEWQECKLGDVVEIGSSEFLRFGTREDFYKRFP